MRGSMFEIIKVEFLSEIANEVLQRRAKRAHCGRSLEFVAVVNGVEQGLLSYEDWSSNAEGLIYEIFVLPLFRGGGVGVALLLYAENLARQLGCRYIRLKPYALDSNTDQERLTSWYIGKGYAHISAGREFIEKSLII